MHKCLILLLLLGACSFKKSLIENQTQKGHEELYSEPDAVPESIKSHKRIVIAATNDMEGTYSIQNLKVFDDEAGDGTIAVGGVDIIAGYFNILRKQYSNLVVVDSGDLFSGETKDASIVSDFYARLGYDAFTIGLSDFNVKLPKNQSSNTDFFKEFAKKSKTPLILSNLYDLKTARIVEWTGAQPYLLKEVDGSKIGIIGLVPDDVVAQTPVDNRVGLYVESMLQSTLRHARLLRSLGADIIVVITSQGLDCGTELAQDKKLPLAKVNFEPRAKSVCDVQGALGEYLMRLPPHLVDVVVGGRNHQKVANYVNETLVLSSFGQGKSFSYVEFFIDTESKKLIKEKTIVHQPVMFCREFFKESKDCFNEDDSINHKARIPATFLGEKVIPDANIQKHFEDFFKATRNQSHTKTSLGQELIENTLTAFDAQIIYFKNGSGNTQLLILELGAEEFSNLLEEELNGSQEAYWLPSPFKKTNEGVTIALNSSKLIEGNKYRILSDLESLQNHHLLKKLIDKRNVKPFMTYSRQSLLHGEVDEVSTVLAQRKH